MPTNVKLNLKGVLSPICLLKCKSVLAGMSSGNVLEIKLRDPDVVQQLVKIVERSKDRVIQSKMEKDYYHVFIKKH